MKTLLVTLVFTLSTAVSFAKTKKIDWSLCEREVRENCSKLTDNHEIHECIEKLPKEKVSDECREKNESLEKEFKGKHGKGHKH